MDYDKIKSDKKEFWYDYIWYLKKVDFYTFLYKHLKDLCDELERKIKVCSSTLNFICPNCKKHVLLLKHWSMILNVLIVGVY
jgi:transcription initiation factor IIE alpha subunit